MEKKKESMIMLPIKDWMAYLKETRIEASIKDCTSVEIFLENFRK